MPMFQGRDTCAISVHPYWKMDYHSEIPERTPALGIRHRRMNSSREVEA
jgi:hypothetical protein